MMRRKLKMILLFTLTHCLTFLILVPVYCHSFDITVGGIFSSNTSAPYLAAELGIEDINKKSDSIKIVLKAVFAECEELNESTLLGLIKLPYVPIWLIGCQYDCNAASELIDSHSITNRVIVCYGVSESPPYENVLHKHLFLAVPDPYSINLSSAKLISHFKRRCVTLMSQQNYAVMADNLIWILGTIGLNSTWLEIENNVSATFNNLPANVKSFLVLSDQDTARMILCEAYKRGLYGNRYLWMFLDSYWGNWYIDSEDDSKNVNCTEENMKTAANGHFTAKSLHWNKDEDSVTTFGITVWDFKARLHRDLQHKIYDYDEAPIAYDAMWASFIAIRESLLEYARVHGQDYNPLSNIGLKISLENVTFNGISGEFSFNENTRIRSIANAVVEIKELINDNYIGIGHYECRTNQFIDSSEISLSILQDEDGDCDPPTTRLPITPSPSTPTNKTANINNNCSLFKFWISIVLVYQFICSCSV